MNPVLQWLIPMVSAPATLLLLRFINAFNMKPLAIWTIPTAALTVVVSIGGAFIARIADKNMSKRKRRRRFLIFLLAMLPFGFIYDYLYRIPPFDNWKTLYDISAVVTYFGTHFAYGFCVAEIATILIETRTGK